MEIKIRNYSSIYIVDLTGEIDLYNYFKLKEVILKMIDKGIKNYIINFENVTYLDSSGIGAIIFINTKLKSLGHNLFLVNINGSVKRVIELTNLIGFLPIKETIQEAIDLFEKNKE